MNLSKADFNNEKWQLIKLQFRELIRNEGFFVTSRGRFDSLYILLSHEMGPANDAKNKANFKNLKQRQRSLYMIDQSLLSKEAQKKLEFEIFRNASFEIEMASKLKERCRF